MKQRIIAVILLALLTFSMLILSSCSAFSEEMYSDIFGAENGMARVPKRAAEENRSVSVNSEKTLVMPEAESISDGESQDVAAEAEVIFYDENRYIETLDYMSDYEIIEYVMPALELSEEFSGTYSACSDWYYSSYYALWEEENIGDYDNVAALTNYSTESYERTYGKDIYSIYGDYLGDRNLITNGHRMCKSSEFSCYEDVEAYLLNYFSSSFTADKMDDVIGILWEYDGELYHTFIDSYVGWYSHDVDTAAVLSTRPDACKISVTCYTTRGDECQGLFEFIIEDNKLVLDSIEYVS